MVNNNIKIQDGLYQYKDGTPVSADELIHIHANGTAMTGAVHTEDSVQIYPVKPKQQLKKEQQIRQAPTTYSGGSGGGGGY